MTAIILTGLIEKSVSRLASAGTFFEFDSTGFQLSALGTQRNAKFAPRTMRSCRLKGAIKSVDLGLERGYPTSLHMYLKRAKHERIMRMGLFAF